MKFKGLLITLVLLVLLMTNALAAEWVDGRSPAQPYPGVREVDLTKTIGYMMIYPKENMPAQHFCNLLQINLPRDDVKAGTAEFHLFLNGTEIFTTPFDDEEYVEVRPMNEEELDGVLWGGGTAFVIHLPTSLKLGGDYYVNMDTGCIVSTDGTVQSAPISNTTSWKPLVEGTYGIEALTYMRDETAAATPVPAAVDETTEETEASEDSTTEETEDTPVIKAIARSTAKGDRISFRLVLGGEAASAVVYDPDMTLYFDDSQMTNTGTYTGTVIANKPGYWGIAFLDAQGNLIDLVELGYVD